MSKRSLPPKDDTKGTTTRDVNAAMRAASAMKMRAEQRLTYEEIARQCGYADRRSCHKAVQRELERTVVTNANELRREELAQLEYLQYECLKRLRDTRYEKSMLFAVDRILQISERRAKLLGLDTKPDDALMANITVIREIPMGLLGAVEAKPE